MTEDRLPLNELLQKAGDGDFLRAVAGSVLQLLMEADVEELIGAGRHERAADQLNWRNGYRDRTRSTRGNSLSLKIEAAGRQLLPAVPGGAQDDGKGVGRRHPGRPGSAGCRRAGSTRSRRRWDFPASRRARSRSAVQGNRRAREGLPGTSARGRLALSVAGCDLSEGARGRTHRLGRRDNRYDRQHRRGGARSSGSASARRKPRPSAGRTSLKRLTRREKPARRQARDLGRARRG